ncbi:MAG: rRNA biogenesis protein rrp5 [Streptococcaceae bacterium]|nr:rRNA biogenesis protein rrp5 [Streptococcaceae bacterium]
MSRIKLLLQVTEDVQHLADSLKELCDAMQSGEPEPQVTQEPKNEAKSPTLVDVRTVLARKSQEGKSAEVKALIAKYDAERLSDIKEAHFTDLLKDAEGL